LYTACRTGLRIWRPAAADPPKPAGTPVLAIESENIRSRCLKARRLREKAVDYDSNPFFTRKINFDQEKFI
jgi:hypothetical protein